MADNVPMVTITAARLAELEAAEERLAKRNHSNIERLRAYTKANPFKATDATERSMKWYARNREEYNAKRREKRRLAKGSAAVTPVDGV